MSLSDFEINALCEKIAGQPGAYTSDERAALRLVGVMGADGYSFKFLFVFGGVWEVTIAKGQKTWPSVSANSLCRAITEAALKAAGVWEEPASPGPDRGYTPFRLPNP